MTQISGIGRLKAASSYAERSLDGRRCAIDDEEVRPCRPLRFALALLPVPQRIDAETESRGERLLSHPEFPSDRLHIDLGGHVDAIRLPGSATLRVSNGLFQALPNTVCCSAHRLGLRYEVGSQ